MAKKPLRADRSSPDPQLASSRDAQRAGHDALTDIWQSMAGMKWSADTMASLQQDYLTQATDLWNRSLQSSTGGAVVEAPSLSDRRFASAAWLKNPAAAYTAQMYLLNARTMMGLAESIEADAKTRARLRFAVQQWIDATSPTNYLALNPDVQQKALETQGASLTEGLKNLVHDLQQGHVSHTDETVFEVGRNVATTEGAVVFENDFFQLIEYAPLTPQVHARPMLFVPPCINKFYILDLQPDNSLIRYTVAQGHRTFVVSWRNPDESMADKTWDDYIEQGPIAAIRAVQTITGVKAFNMLGFCVGGTILATALAVLAARGEQPAHSLTLLTTLLDFSDTGILDIFVDEHSVKLREMTIGAEAPGGPGLLRGKELATTFNFLRPNDLVWNYVVGNYLKGESPPPFDLLYWNGDSTNLPGPMYCWYLRHTYLQDQLKQPGQLKVCGQQVDLGAIQAPVYIYGSREDHIVPWAAAYRSVPLMKGPRRFVMGASGHIAGVINPAAKNKRSYWIAPPDRDMGGKKGVAKGGKNASRQDALPDSPDAWLKSAQEIPGSWWNDWSAWLNAQGGKLQAAPRQLGGGGLRAIEPAPGRYVKVRA
jgi:polyhydroxyalkanoate synthase subunit PhaC